MREHTMFPFLYLCLFVFNVHFCFANSNSSTSVPFVFTAETMTALPGSRVCSEYTVENFNDVLSYQFGVKYNTEVLTFVEANSNVLEPSELFANLPATGEPVISVSWGSLSGIPLSISDNTVLFSLCFDVVNEECVCSPLEFTELPSAAQGAQISVATVGQEYFQDNITFIDGQICAQSGDGSMQSEIVTFDADNDGTATGAMHLEVTCGQGPYTVNVMNCNTNEVLYTAIMEDQNIIINDLLSGNYCVEILDSSAPNFVNSSTEQIGSCNIPVLSEFIMTNISCPDGSDGVLECITEAASIPINSYTWSDGSQTYSGNPISEIPAGTYTVTISDAIGCSIIETVSLETPANFEINLNTSFNINPTCNGDSDGSLHVFVNGGSAPYQYTLQDGTSLSDGNETVFEGLNGGDYIVSVEDVNGCQVTSQTFTLENPGIIFETIQQSICEGETFEGYSIAGSYVDQLTSMAGCDSIRTLVLEVATNDSVFIEAIICEGDDLEGYTQTGTYEDILQGNDGCDSVRTLVLNVNPNINVILQDTICEGESLEGYTATGLYADVFPASNGCDSTRTLELVVLPLSDAFCMSNPTNNLSKENHLKIFPNPAQDVLHIVDETQFNDKIQLISAEGKILKQFKIQGNLLLHINDIPQGVYFLKGLSERGSEILRFVKL